MKTSLKVILASSMIATISVAANAEFRLKPSPKHTGYGLGLALNQVPFSLSNLILPLSYVYYEYQFVEPLKTVRTSIEGGFHGFYGFIPVPEAAANLYLGSEQSDIQAKIGLGGFYDIGVGGHAGLSVKTGVVLKNRMELNLFVVPTGTDAKRSYYEVLGIGKGDNTVKMPYFGFMIGLRN